MNPDSELNSAEPPTHEQIGARLRERMQLSARDTSAEKIARLEACATAILCTLGLDLETPATRDTPRRFIAALTEATAGYEGDPKLLTVFETECRGGPDCRSSQIIEGAIRFFSLCEHHSLPFFGDAYVGYIAHEHIIGISKLTRLVRLFAMRFSVQERIGQQIADTLEAILEPHGVGVYIEARHMCTQMRGVHEITPLTRTNFWRGVYDSDPAVRAEFLSMCGRGR